MSITGSGSSFQAGTSQNIMPPIQAFGVYDDISVARRDNKWNWSGSGTQNWTGSGEGKSVTDVCSTGKPPRGTAVIDVQTTRHDVFTLASNGKDRPGCPPIHCEPLDDAPNPDLHHGGHDHCSGVHEHKKPCESAFDFKCTCKVIKPKKCTCKPVKRC